MRLFGWPSTVVVSNSFMGKVCWSSLNWTSINTTIATTMMLGKWVQHNQMKNAPLTKRTCHKLNKINQSELDDARINNICIYLLGFARVRSAYSPLKHWNAQQNATKESITSTSHSWKHFGAIWKCFCLKTRRALGASLPMVYMYYEYIVRGLCCLDSGTLYLADGFRCGMGLWLASAADQLLPHDNRS